MNIINTTETWFEFRNSCRLHYETIKAHVCAKSVVGYVKPENCKFLCEEYLCPRIKKEANND